MVRVDLGRPGVVVEALERRDDEESSIGRYLRHLRDDVGLALGDFTNWPEWEAIDGVTVAIERLATRSRIGCGIVDDDEQRKKIATLPHIVIDDSQLQVSEPIVHLLPGACEAAAATAQAFIGRGRCSLT